MTMDDRWTSAMVTWLITSILLISQVQSRSVAIVQWSPHTTAVIGQSLTLACAFDSPVTCTWSRGGLTGSTPEVRSGNGYYYAGDYTKTNKATTDCSMTIDTVKREDFAMWYCTAYSGTQIRLHSPWIYITEQVTPSPPVIRFNNNKVSSIELPSPDPPTHMVCSSSNGNPAPSLHWQVDGRVYRGKLETTPANSSLYTVHLRWDRATEWQIFENVSEIICKADHTGFTQTMTARVAFRRQFAKSVEDVKQERDVPSVFQLLVSNSVKISSVFMNQLDSAVYPVERKSTGATGNRETNVNGDFISITNQIDILDKIDIMGVSLGDLQHLVTSCNSGPNVSVANIRLVECGSSKLGFQWDPLPCDPTNGSLTYRYVLRTTEDAPGRQVVVVNGTTADTKVTLQHLKAFTQYQLSLSGLNSGGEGPMVTCVHRTLDRGN